MNDIWNKNIHKSVSEMARFCGDSDIFSKDKEGKLPSRDVVTEILKDLRKVVFPGYFGDETLDSYAHFAEKMLGSVSEKLCSQIKLVIGGGDADKRAEDICTRFISALPEIQKLLEKDVRAMYDGDPAAHGTEEIISSYPGILAIFVYRLAHVLYAEKVPMIPRMMTEYAHSRTGIAINAGATIGEYFFIDHGTGIVIGETTVIGDRVKLYQGVTLGALSTRKGQGLSGVKRHPTIGNDVTVYSGASILGGETVVGDGAIIGGNAFITSSVPPRTKVIVKTPEHIFKTDAPEGNWEI